MGEKGNDLDHGLAAVAAATTGGMTSDPSMIERVTTTTTQTIVGTGKDALASLKDKALDKGSDAMVDEARARLRPAKPPEGTTAPPSGPTSDARGDDDDPTPR